MVTRVTRQNYLSVLPKNQVNTYLQGSDIEGLFFDSDKNIFVTGIMPSEDLY